MATTKRSSLFILFILISCVTILATAQRKHTISGTITDAQNGEVLIGATVYAPKVNMGTTANEYGFYSLTLPEGSYTIEFSYLGYKMQSANLDLKQDRRLNIKLEESSNMLDEVVISGEGRNANVSRIEMSVQKLSAKTIKNIPAMMGEADVIKAIQMLPGVQSVSEGSSSFSVRGGGHDQNLILLDEAPVYSASHLMGFFSVFNNDVIRDVQLYKGDIPAVYGGRLSSLMDVRTKDGNNQRISGTGGIGTIASRLTLEGPIFTDKLTFVVAGRRTYADIFLPLAKDETVKDSKLYFYDLNAKVNYKINDNNRVYVAAYLGRDKFGHELMGMDFGNKTLTARWNHIFTPQLFSNFTFIASHYDYYMGTTLSETIAQDWKSELKDFGLKADMSYHINPDNSLRFGYNFTHHTFYPGKGGGIGENTAIEKFEIPQKYAMDHAAYISHEVKLFEKLSIRYGLRYTAFQNIGNGEYDYLLNSNYQITDSTQYTKGEVYNNQSEFEPRVALNYMFNDLHSVKASYSRTAQFIQLASNSAAGSPFDLWFQSSRNIKPQVSDQVAIGYFRNFNDNMFETSVELYYKDMKNVIDFKDHAELLGKANLETELRFGVGYAYGAEFMIRKNTGDLTGWVSYTYSRSFRKIDEVNDGDWFRSPYDRPHSISVVMNYELSKRWSFGVNWVYATGVPVTFPTGKFEVEGTYIPIYSKRNEYRYPDYHRMDISATWKLSKPNKKFQHELNISVYNAYGRKNPWTITFRQQEENPNVTYSEMTYLFSVVPSITWNFNF